MGMMNQFKAIIIDGSHSNERSVNQSIVLVKQHTYIKFPMALDLNYFLLTA